MNARCASTRSAPISVVVYRCSPIGVGWGWGGTSSRSHGLGCLVGGGGPGAHQHPGDEGSEVGFGVISFPVSRAECRLDERQRVSCICEKVMRSDRIGTRESSEASPVSRSQGIEENENLEYSFLGFTQEN